MADGAQNRTTTWRQGMVLDDKTVELFGLVTAEAIAKTVVVVVSHDCDIANLQQEPLVEVIAGLRIDRLGADTNAKSARCLHMAFQTPEGVIPVELIATDKRTIDNDQLRTTEPRAGWQLTPEDRNTLQHWLAARYRRSAFPEAFEDKLKAKPAQMHRKIAKAVEWTGEHILAILFDLDNGIEQERPNQNDLYKLHITLLYNSNNDEPTAFAATEKAAQKIEDEFLKAFSPNGGSDWVNIQLIACDAVSDNAMTIAQSRVLKHWRLEHMSLEDEPQQLLFEGLT